MFQGKYIIVGEKNYLNVGVVEGGFVVCLQVKLESFDGNVGNNGNSFYYVFNRQCQVSDRQRYSYDYVDCVKFQISFWEQSGDQYRVFVFLQFTFLWGLQGISK